MMRHRIVRAATWIVLRLVPSGERDFLMGDLVEEYTLRARGTSSSSAAALKWYLRQVCASIPPLLVARITHGLWIATSGVALLGYSCVGVVQFLVNWAIGGPVADPYNPLGLVIMFPIVALIGYFAARFRRRAATVLAAIMLLVATMFAAWSAEKPPLIYRLAFFSAGPSAALIGGTLQWFRRKFLR